MPSGYHRKRKEGDSWRWLDRRGKDLLSKLSAYNEQAYAALEALKRADAEAIAQPDHLSAARVFSDKVVPAMQALRTPVDAMEALMPSALWPVPTYGEMTYKQ